MVKKLFWAGRLAIGAAAFVPLFLFMVLFNFKVDCQGYFQGDQELRDVVELMLNGHDVVGAERLNNSQRKIIKTFVHNMENVPATIALGSSRVMMISSEMLGTDSFYNCAITGADMYDLIGHLLPIRAARRRAAEHHHRGGPLGVRRRGRGGPAQRQGPVC